MYFRTLSAQVVGRGEPVDFPASVQNLPDDVVMVLSDGDFVSFAARSIALHLTVVTSTSAQ